jgi:uncharacterized membrane protein
MKPQGPLPEADDPVLAYARQLTLVVYVLHAAASVTVITFFVAIFISYSRYDRARGTIYQSHFNWQIGAFWYAFVFFVLGVALCVWGAITWFGRGDGGAGLIVCGLVLLFANWCWHLYRVIRGLIHWNERRPMPD